MGSTRPHRSELAVPGSNRRMLDKARLVDSDLVMLDLEDAVTVDEKVAARGNVIAALGKDDWRARGLSLRIKRTRHRVVLSRHRGRGRSRWRFTGHITVPRVGSAADVHFVSTLLDQIEASVGLDVPLGLSVPIEAETGMVHVNEIAAACPKRDGGDGVRCG